jgi:hypothetical protein
MIKCNSIRLENKSGNLVHLEANSISEVNSLCDPVIPGPPLFHVPV